MNDKKRMNWGSRLSFILVSAGATIGFGNIWRFPYLVGQNGGGAFLLMFLACIALIGIPLLVTEMVIGRRMSTNSIDAFTVKIGQKLTQREQKIKSILISLAEKRKKR